MFVVVFATAVAQPPAQTARPEGNQTVAAPQDDRSAVLAPFGAGERESGGRTPQNDGRSTTGDNGRNTVGDEVHDDESSVLRNRDPLVLNARLNQLVGHEASVHSATGTRFTIAEVSTSDTPSSGVLVDITFWGTFGTFDATARGHAVTLIARQLGISPDRVVFRRYAGVTPRSIVVIFLIDLDLPQPPVDLADVVQGGKIDEKRLSDEAIVGIALGSVLVVLFMVLSVVRCCRRVKEEPQSRRSTPTVISVYCAPPDREIADREITPEAVSCP